MPCVHAIAAIRKKQLNPKDFVHKWLCMKSFHATYKYNINLVPSEEYWGNTSYLKTYPPVIKRPIDRPKVHNRKRDPVEDLIIECDKLKKTFKCQLGSSHRKKYKSKQPIRRASSRRSPSPTISTAPQQQPPASSTQTSASALGGGPSKETMSATSKGT
ncbi:hypothetical protein PIB30_050099 [Stylosanthes scabra]|uniref:SWIM-type domain-containing protein n=1 Tax=Stylosanthes scabra TaxID=79078 RepID=A0ABU6YEZ5_9FABA|nr:hypothetical protein [Stylosanthes scabra]